MKAFFSVLVGAGIWGTTGLFVKSLPLSVLVFCALRTLVPTILSVLIFLVVGRRRSFLRGGGMLYLASLLNALRLFLYYNAMLLGSIGNVVITLYTWPLLVVLFNAILLRRRPSVRMVFAVSMAFVGMCFVVANSKATALNSGELVGVGLMFLASVTTAVFVIVFKRQARDLNVVESIYYQNVGGVLFLVALVFGLPEVEVAAGDLVVAFAYSALVGFGGFAFFFYGLRRLPEVVASSLTFFEVVSAMVLAHLFLGEAMTKSMLLGAGCIVASGILVQKQF